MFRCVLSAARDVPFSSYSRKVAWLQHVRRGVNADFLRSPICDISFRFSSLSRLCNNVRCVSSHEWNSQTSPSNSRIPHRTYSSGGENDGEKRKGEEGKGQELDNEDGLDDEFRDLLKEISKDFDSGDSDGGEEKKTPSDSNMNAANQPAVSLDPRHDASFPAAEELPQPPIPTPTLMADEIEDFTQHDEMEAEDEVEPDKVLPVKLTRGERGVYDLDDLMKVLASVKAIQPCVICIPRARKYVEHMVIASALSFRHMKAIAHQVIWIYKRRKAETDPYLQVEGLDTSREWFAMDMGNIALHIFMPEARRRYDLEMLWCLGPELDPQCQEDADPYTLTPADLLLMEVNKAKLADQGPDDQGEKPTVIVTGCHDNDEEVFMGLDNRPRHLVRSKRSKSKPARWQH